MEQSQILFVCLAALIGIFVVLPFLAFLMHLIVLLFPQKETPKSSVTNTNEVDSAIYAAITSAYKSLYPGTKVTEIVENK